MDYFIMDNDSGYVSHNQESSNFDSSSENVYQPKTCTSSYDLYLNEDTLLERPLLHNNELQQGFDSFDSVINCSQESVKTEFSGFNESGLSDSSLIIPEVQPIVCDSRMWTEDEPNHSPVKTTSFPKVLANVTNTYDKNASQNTVKNPLDKENIPPSITPKKCCENSKENIPSSVTPKKYNKENMPSSVTPRKYNKDFIASSVTPKKCYVNPLSSAVSPDLFAEEEMTLRAMKLKSPIKRISPKEVYSSKDTKLLKNVQSSLSGVHPPPSVTIIQMNATEMLSRIEANKEFFWKASTVTQETSKSLLINNKEECTRLEWPEISKCRYHGLHYNRNKLSEEFEHLCLKHAERYIGVETQSSCTIFDSNPPSSQKRKMVKPRWSVKSPGRRLSHLARRRITFSSANIQANSSSAILGSRTRQILVDARKLNSLRKSPRKTPSKSPFKIRKNSPSSSAKKKLAMRFREMSGELDNCVPSTSSEQSGQGFKRALFSNERETGNFGASIEKKSTKRALFVSPLKHSPNKKSPFKLSGLDKKRKRTDTETSNPSKFSRSMSFDLQPTKSDSNSSSSSGRIFSESFTSGRRSEELTEQHKKKLQWAVYESLRLQNVTPTHPQFKVFASVLARVTRKFLPNLRYEGRTSEKMLRVARHHSYAVIKGKSVDEIVNEYLKNRLKNQKPQGYIGIEEYNKSKDNNSGSKENVLQNKVNTVKASEKGREVAGSKTRFFSQNRIDRIKKVISFEEKDA